MKYTILSLSIALATLALPTLVHAHCQVPCGIYGDDRVLAEINEDVATIEKAMQQINTLSAESGKNANQITRWVINKEKHAQKIQDTAQQYFLAQRLKLNEAETDAKAYQQKLGLLHQIIVYAMKCKQTTDQANVDALRKAIAAFSTAYNAKK